MAAYAADALKTDTPWKFWQFQRPCFGGWNDCDYHPEWVTECNYRRKSKSNSQVACELLDKAYDALEGHSVIVCEPNVDHIQRLVLDAKLLLQMPEDKPALKQHTIVLTTEQLKELVFACTFPSWENEDFQSARTILNNTLKGE
jgi:hypothetical protein